jgi:uncharacterized protein (DUF302 family)
MGRNQLTASHSDNVMVAIPANVKCWSMTNEENTIYGFNTKLRLSFDETIERVLTALKVEGFGVLSDIDVQYAMKEKLGVDMPPYRILGACNPPLAHKALQAEPDIGLLLPCNVVVRQEAEGHVTVVFIHQLVMMQMVDKPEVQAVAKDAEQRLRRVCESVAH